MVIAFKCKSRRSISLERRDFEALNAHDRLSLRQQAKKIEYLMAILPLVRKRRIIRKCIIESLIMEYIDALKIVIVEVPDRGPRLNYMPMNFLLMNDHLINIGVTVSERFRFQSFDAMRRILICFNFPLGPITLKKNYKSRSEEIILISLSRLSFPLRWSDLYERFPGRKSWFLREAFYWFINFMISNWAYLLLNNLEWWKPKIAESCESIRLKLQSINHINWRQYHDPPFTVNINNQFVHQGFRVAFFIDDTMMAFSRPGGNIDEGPAAPRVPNEIQEAWYNGWKKLHGMKWQTVMLANGMDFNIYGPLSVRRNDLTALDKSDIEAKIRALFNVEELWYIIFGDSAFMVSDMMATSESYPGRGMASVREAIEWSYKDVKQLWKYCDYKHILQLRKQPVAKIFFICLLLRNVYVTLHGSQVSDYFTMMPPTLEEWTSQGMQAHPIPNNHIFGDNYDMEDDDDQFNYDDDDDDEDDEMDE